MILVVTLAIIVLVTVAVLAFFSHAISNRQVESSRTNRTEAALLAHTGQDYVTGLFLEEIAANSTNSPVNGVTIYFPNSPTNSLAQRTLGPNISLTDTNFFNLIRQSVPGVDTNASTNNTLETARNGRMITAERWNAPRLLGGQGFQTNQLPNWIYVTRSGGITNAPSRDVIGRFAYNAYDIGGLLDVSAAGYPSGPSGMAATNISSLKSTVAGADLTQLPGVTTNAVNDLLGFRNPGATNNATYPIAVSALAQKGFLTSRATNSTETFTNNAFMNRQDLLRYARLRNTALTNALPYLTHFSRAVNAPSWTPPSTPANTNPNIPDVRFTTGGMVPHFRDDGFPEPYSVKAGDPFLQRRFSLAKLDWITPWGPSASLSSSDPRYNAGGTAANIQTVFGLKWDNGNKRWDYVGSIGSGSPTLGAIKTLAQVAGEPTLSDPTLREPNFFELLKAGVLNGSLGSAAGNNTYNIRSKTLASYCSAGSGGVGSVTLDSNKDLHILRIGANIIDCADSDNYPTILAMQWGSETVEKAGVEDLPYFYSVDLVNLRQSTKVGATTDYSVSMSRFVMVPELFNPHRPSSPAGGQTPSSVKIEIMQGYLLNVGFWEGGGGPTGFKMRGPQPYNNPKDLSGMSFETSATDSLEVYRSTPGPVRRSGDSASLGALVPEATSGQDALAFLIFDHSNSAEYSTPLLPVSVPGTRLALAQMSELVISLRYQPPGSTSWKTYTTLGGNETFAAETGIDGENDDPSFPTIRFSKQLKDQSVLLGVLSPAFLSADPRSSRFGPLRTRYERPLAHPPQSATSGPGWNYGSVPPSTQPSGIQSFFLPNTYTMSPAVNLPQAAAFEDPDTSGNPRPPDGNIADAANPYRDLTGMNRRPVILQRPYHSVAELGYVFRDMPWQTLDFYNNRSADAALLDLFAVRDEPPVTAGRVALNTRHLPVLKALLAASSQESDGTLDLSPASVQNVAADFTGRYAFNAGVATATIPLNVAGLANFMSSTNSSIAGLDPIKYRREAVVRALASAQTRTWNVLVDVVAQAGRFPENASDADDFMLEGESRVWSSLAIDRYTGKIIGQQKEEVHE